MRKHARILVFTGPGKGKTTAALGMVLRASGHGMRALVVQFIKRDMKTGENKALGRLEGVRRECFGLGFLPDDSHDTFAEHRRRAERGLRRAAEAMRSGEYALVVMDEVCLAAAKGLLPVDDVATAVREAPGDCVVVLTGRNCPEELLELADTATRMECVKHGLQGGIKAQKGVDL